MQYPEVIVNLSSTETFYPSSNVYEVHMKTHRARSPCIFFVPNGILLSYILQKGKPNISNYRNRSLAKKKKKRKLEFHCLPL